MPIPNSFVHHSVQIIDAGALDDHEIFDKEPVFGVPTGVENACCWVE
jgi:hypothetical protein